MSIFDLDKRFEKALALTLEKGFEFMKNVRILTFEGVWNE